MSVSRLALIAALVSLAHGSAFAQSWTPIPGAVLDRLSVDPNDADHLVHGDNVGFPPVWRETFDGGANWSALVAPTLPAGLEFRGYHIDESGELVLFGARDGSVGPSFMVRNGGTWQAFGPGVMPPVSGTPVSGVRLTRGVLDPNLVVLELIEPFTFGRGFVALSGDGGATWTNPEIVLQGSARLDIVEGTGSPYVVRESLTGFITPIWNVRRSIGFGAPTQTLFTVDGNSLEFAFSPRYPETMWAAENGDWPNPPNTTLSRSRDCGASWTVLSSAPGSFGYIAHPTREGWLIRSSSAAGLELSRDAGDTFESLNLTGRPLTFVEEGRYLFAFDTALGVVRTELFPAVGAQECSAQVNGTGAAATITAEGSLSVASNDLALVAKDVTPNQFGFFVVSANAGFTPSPNGSFGDLCLSGEIGRFNGLLQDSGAFGRLFGEVDLSSLPLPTGFIAAQAGQAWRFQAWFRDVQVGVQGSNFSDVVRVSLLP